MSKKQNETKPGFLAWLCETYKPDNTLRFVGDACIWGNQGEYNDNDEDRFRALAWDLLDQECTIKDGDLYEYMDFILTDCPRTPDYVIEALCDAFRKYKEQREDNGTSSTP